jgi:hypothetical protein
MEMQWKSACPLADFLIVVSKAYFLSLLLSSQLLLRRMGRQLWKEIIYIT